MKGNVFLVGAGPGDAQLITLKGLECIKKADVIVYDRLVSKKLLDYKKKHCELIYVGKKSSHHTKTQEEINEIMYQKALEGKVVTRLKGGDPYVFGRGGEEAQYLKEKKIDVEVIPGITSAIGGLAYAGIPITHRNHASSFHVITGHLKEEEKDLNWKVLAKLKGTLVFLMGMSELEHITQNLIKNGMEEDTPVAVINWATTNKQTVVTGTLKDIYEITLKKALSSPSIIVVGRVVNLRQDLNFFENKPLYGKKILVTRARNQASKLTQKIYELGGTSIEFPVIQIKDLSNQPSIIQEIQRIEQYNYIIFTSQNGAKLFFHRFFSLGLDIRKLANMTIVSIGKATAKEIEKYHLHVDIIPKKYIAEGIFEELKDRLVPEDKILIPRAKNSRDFLIEQLSNICLVKELKIYETLLGEGVESKEKIKNLLKKKEIDYVTFTSSSTVRNLIKILKNPKILQDIKLISIGPITSKAIENFGLNVYKQAKNYDIDGLIEILKQD
ncbi:uroporphyrinogen-III C-methyltransferase [Garciella nitratireducens]|uniref:uroporphyrinogen-III C-methyltransferase n=1 Tax=Garciella nitratireducens DSM 15102 TaxID=1121911 RepID=A0A1T4KJ87_9FIRM|nr:uroporphyrinogen-III C-methyltransferase [Garciella nitratireducens]SJZ42423.1 uroporphyrinogen-III synthase [Garciella nitratireducens DSM 15102]